MIRKITNRSEPYLGLERVDLECGHYRFWSKRAFAKRTTAKCELCDATEMYHGTAASYARNILREGKMDDRTVGTTDSEYARSYGRTKMPRESQYALIVLDVAKAKLKPAVTGYFESNGEVPLSGIIRIHFYDRTTEQIVQTIIP